MYKMVFMDGEPVPEEYQEAVASMVTLLCEIEEEFDITELDGGAK